MEALTPEEVRVLGALVEKQLATPQHYPLTENALLGACNQTTNRYPVVTYDQSIVRPALIQLREQGLAKRVRREGERAEKHAHRLHDTLGLATGPLAVLAVLLLRGAQTPGELRTRTERLHPFPDAAALDAALTDLRDRGLAERLERRPGEKQARWRHLLSGHDAPIEAPEPTAPTGVDLAGPAVPTLRELAQQVEALSARITTLERELGLEGSAAGDGGNDSAEPAVGSPILDHRRLTQDER